MHRDAYNVAVAYAMDYSNVPWWADPDNRVMAGQSDITGAVNILRRLTLPFVKWPYNNMARQIKRFGVDSATDTFTYLAAKTLTAIPGLRDTTVADWARGHASAKGVTTLTPRLANSLAHLGTFAMMLGILRAALMSGKGDDDELDRLGRSFDQAGKRLDRQFDTSSRVNISDVPLLGPMVRSLAKMFGDENGTDDYWLRVRTIPYASPMLAMAAAGAALLFGVSRVLLVGDSLAKGL